MERVYSESEAPIVAKEIITKSLRPSNTACVIVLTGDLGAGKTTLVQHIAHALGVDESVSSPTFVVMKHYTITNGSFSDLYHLDAYRIEHTQELLPLQFDSILKNPNALLILEWGERIKEVLPTETIYITLSHYDESHRKIIYET